jgi:hypothetical protein
MVATVVQGLAPKVAENEQAWCAVLKGRKDTIRRHGILIVRDSRKAWTVRGSLRDNRIPDATPNSVVTTNVYSSPPPSTPRLDKAVSLILSTQRLPPRTYPKDARS